MFRHTGKKDIMLDFLTTRRPTKTVAWWPDRMITVRHYLNW